MIILFPALSVSITLSFTLPNVFPKTLRTTIELIGVNIAFKTDKISFLAASLVILTPLACILHIIDVIK